MTTYYVRGDTDDWTASNAKTLSAAKRECTELYRHCKNIPLYVGARKGNVSDPRIKTVTWKDLTGKWNES